MIAALNYILALIACISGLFLGIIVSLLAQEELKDGKKYFKLIQNIIIVLVLFFVMEFYQINIYLSLAVSAVLLFLLFYLKTLNREKRDFIIYPLFGIVFFLLKDSQLILVTGSLIFIYSLLSAGIFSEERMKKNKIQFKQAIQKLLICAGLFVCVAVILLISQIYLF